MAAEEQHDKPSAEEAAHEPQSVDELPEGASDDALDDTCGFCRFMKSGPCGKIFKEWEDCVDSHRDDEEQSFVDTCYSHTQALKECMDRNPEYYQTINEEDSDEDPAQAKGDRDGKNATASQHAERNEEGERQEGDA